MQDKKSLSRYFKVVEGKKKAKFLSADLTQKKEKAREILSSCHFCERRCGVDRTRGEKGICGVLKPKISTEFVHLGEEPEVVPSHTIFFSGCTFSCVYCQNWDISQSPEKGNYITPRELAQRIKKKEARNVNWAGGDPTPNLYYILRVLEELQELEVNIPQVWNSNMYLSQEGMELLDNVIDVYLTDFKYGNDDCAQRLSKVENYCQVIQRNHSRAEKQGEMIIRHLVLPNHVKCCTKPILRWISQNLENYCLNIMDQYRPEYNALRFEDIGRKLESKEFQKALHYAQGLGLKV